MKPSNLPPVRFGAQRQANALAEDLCPRERLLFSAEILSVPGDNQEASEVTLEA